MFSKYLSIVDPSSLTLGIVTGVTCVVVYNTIVFYWNVRKYSIDKSLPLNVIPCIDEALDNMRRDKVFYAIDHLSPMLSAIAASSAFGRRYPFADQELKQITEDMDYVTESTMTIILVEFLP